jgi:sulfite reductase (ferredoxin)
MTEVKETKAQKVERLKREKFAWERLDEIREFARQGHGSIPPEWLGTYFRTWGIYTQGDGLGVVGGKSGEGNATQYFMVRIRIPNGLLTSAQARELAAISEDYGRGVADVTVRQNIQLHWVTIENIPDLIERLEKIGLTTTGACGDVVRNVTGCPVAGIDSHELMDASPLALAVDRELGGNKDFYNLPRKFKMSVTGCSSWCSYPEINDVAFTATTRVRNGAREVGFSVRVAGGLSTEPHLAVKLNAFVRQDQVLAVARGVAQIFRASEVLRQSRDKARLKYLFLQHGWTAETFLAELERQIGFTLDPAEAEQIPADIHRDHLGVYRQKQPGLSYVGAPVLRGRIAPAQLRKVAELAELHGDGHVRLTVQQNILLINIHEAHVNHVVNELNLAGLPVAVSAFARGTVACTGSEFCKLALTETKGFARWLSRELEERLPAWEEQIKLHITGCPNSCGQHWIADIGIEGKKIKVGGKMVDAYYFCLGGSVGQIASIARPVGYRCAATDVPDAIERLLVAFTTNRGEAETLREFLARHSNEDLRTILAGEFVGAVARDLPAASVPHGVEG